MQKTAAKTRKRKQKTGAAADSGPRNRVIERRRMDVSELAVNDKNWRLHPDSQRGALQGILAEIGKVGELYAYKSERTGGQLVLIDGHLRKEQGGVWDVAITDLTDAEADKLLTVYDPLAAEAAVDSAKLAMLLRDVQTATPELADLLTKMAEANGIVPADARGTPGGGDEVPVVAAGPTRCKRGDLWIIRGGNGIEHRLLCGDSTNEDDVRFAVHGERANLIWTDPPYGVNHSGGTKDPRSEDYRSGDKLENDDLNPADLERMFVSAIKNVPATTGATCYAAVPAGPLHSMFMLALAKAGYPYRGQCVWVKNSMVFGRSLYHYRHEPILYGWREDGPHYEDGDRTLTSVFAVDRQQVNEEHPTIKPLLLVEPMIRHSSKPRDIVYDPFIGSGTTLIACHNLGRRCIGIEIYENYCDVILARCEKIGLSVELQK